MKRNDFATYIVYLGMIAIALLVGFLVVRPILGNWSSDYGLLTVILSVLGGAILNSVLLELGHLLGAKAGHYNVYGWTVLGLSFKKDANGKTKVGFSNFEGLTGETKMAPKDIEKATSSGVILLPLVLFLVEVVGGMVMIAFSDRMVNRDAMADAVWMKVVAVVVMPVAGMIFLSFDLRAAASRSFARICCASFLFSFFISPVTFLFLFAIHTISHKCEIALRACPLNPKDLILNISSNSLSLVVVPL